MNEEIKYINTIDIIIHASVDYYVYDTANIT